MPDIEKNSFAIAQEKAKEIVKNEIDKLNKFIEHLDDIHRGFQNRRVESVVHRKWFISYRDNLMGALSETLSTIDIDLWNHGCDHFGIHEEFEE